MNYFHQERGLTGLNFEQMAVLTGSDGPTRVLPATTYTDTRVENNTTYIYFVTAFDDSPPPKALFNAERRIRYSGSIYKRAVVSEKPILSAPHPCAESGRSSSVPSE